MGNSEGITRPGNVNNSFLNSMVAPGQANLMKKIDNFVESIREELSGTGSNVGSPQQPTGPRSAVNVPGADEARSRAEKAIIEAEKFRAAVEDPPR